MPTLPLHLSTSDAPPRAQHSNDMLEALLPMSPVTCHTRSCVAPVLLPAAAAAAARWHSTELAWVRLLQLLARKLPLTCRGKKTEMKASPYETKSDSFYFVGNKMVMHNKAEYAYTT